jgi:hypothetical protein
MHVHYTCDRCGAQCEHNEGQGPQRMVELSSAAAGEAMQIRQHLCASCFATVKEVLTAQPRK